MAVRKIRLANVFYHELAPIPISVFERGELNEHLPDIINFTGPNQGSSRIGECYGSNNKTSMPGIRFYVWHNKTGKRLLTKTPERRALPPTTEAFTENVKRAHVQTLIWKSSLE